MRIGLIGGTGIYDFEGDVTERDTRCPPTE